MFKFLSWFKSKDEQLNDNDYDFNEIPTPVGQEVVDKQLSESIPPAPKERPRTPTPPEPPVDQALVRAEEVKIGEIRDELNGMSDDPAPADTRDRHPFDVRGIDHKLIDKYEPTFLGNGGENIVYDLRGHPRIVARAEVEPIMEEIETAEKEGRKIVGSTDQQTEALRKRKEGEDANYDELVTHFGGEHVPKTRRYVLNVPVSKELLAALYTERGRPAPDVTLETNELQTIVAIQEKMPQIKDPNSLDVRGGFAERRSPKVMGEEAYKQAYEGATQALVCNPESASFDRDQFLRIHPDLRAMLTQADTNPQLQTALKDFVEKSMKYSKETGKGLDLVGEKNILFFKNADSSWNYKLVDALSPYAEQGLQRSEELMQKVVANEPLDDNEKFLLTCAVNYARTLNGLAKDLGIKDNINIMPPGQTIAPSKFWDTLLDLGPPQESPRQEQEVAPHKE